MNSLSSSHSTQFLTDSRKNFMVSSGYRHRPIREKPILGIDYEKLRNSTSGKKFRKNSLTSINSVAALGQQSQPVAQQQAKESILRNMSQSQQFIRPSTSHGLNGQGNSALNSRPPSQGLVSRKLKPQNRSVDVIEEMDFETFKKYKEEFMEYRRQKNGSTSGQHYVSQNGSTNNNQTNSKVKFEDDPATAAAATTAETDSYQQIQLSSKFPKQLTHSLILDRIYSSQPAKHRPGMKASSTTSITKPNLAPFTNPVEEEELHQNSEAVEGGAESGVNFKPEEDKQHPYTANEEGGNQVENSEYSGLGHSQSSTLFDQAHSTQYSRMVDRYIDKNSDYYKHLQGDCICGRCICGKCRCPFKTIPVDLKRGLQTIYQQEFQTFKNLEPLPCITMDFHTQSPSTAGHLKGLSTTYGDFKSHDVKEPVYSKGPQSQKAFAPFCGTTSYKNNFIDWKYTSQEKINAPKEVTVVHDVPFIGKTMYTDNFYKKPMRDKEFEEFIKTKNQTQLKSPMNPDFRYFRETTNQFHYKQFNPEKVSMIKPYQYESSITPSAPEQYKSQHSKEHDSKSTIRCPSRTELNLMKKHFAEKQSLKLAEDTRHFEKVNSKQSDSMPSQAQPRSDQSNLRIKPTQASKYK